MVGYLESVGILCKSIHEKKILGETMKKYLWLLFLLPCLLGLGPGPRVIPRPPVYVTPKCTYYPRVLRFENLHNARVWIYRNRNYIYSPTVHLFPNYVEVWFAEFTCEMFRSQF